MIICLLITVTFGWLGARYIKSKREQQFLADLDRAPYSRYLTSALSDDKIFEKYTPDRLFRIAEQYSKSAVREPSNSVPARIAAGALYYLGTRYDMKSKRFMRDPRVITIAEKFFDSKLEPLADLSTMILLGHHQLCDDIHSSQDLRAVIEDGYDSDNPLHVYLLVTEVYSDFLLSDGQDLIEQNWPTPSHPWGWNLGETPSHTYKDKIDALRQVSPDVADAYAAIIEEMGKCNGKPSNVQRATINGYSNDMLNAMDERTIFQFMLRNLEIFKSEPSLCLPPSTTAAKN